MLNEENLNLYKDEQLTVPVLLEFFVRHEQFARVFEQIRKVRPLKLFLYQDGPRNGNPDDAEGIRRCREIAENIDWPCDVHTYYQENNVGCDPSGFVAQRWFFSNVDMGIVLEDDVVPSISFFKFCEELLEKYKDDTRIQMICGMNNIEICSHTDDSYIFSKSGSVWGWASWSRVVSERDSNYTWIENRNVVDNLKRQIGEKHALFLIDKCKKHKESGREHFETIGGVDLYLQSRLNIVPKYNLVTNIGIANDTTHGTDDIRIYPKAIRKLLYMKSYEIEFPLRHPKYVMADAKFDKEMDFNPLKRFMIAWEIRFRSLRYKGLSYCIKKLTDRIFEPSDRKHNCQ